MEAIKVILPLYEETAIFTWDYINSSGIFYSSRIPWEEIDERLWEHIRTGNKIKAMSECVPHVSERQFRETIENIYTFNAMSEEIYDRTKHVFPVYVVKNAMEKTRYKLQEMIVDPDFPEILLTSDKILVPKPDELDKQKITFVYKYCEYELY